MQYSRTTLACSIYLVLSTVHAESIQNEVQAHRSVSLTPIVVQADKTDEIGTTTYSKEQLENTPNAQKTMTDFLKVNPNVQFSNTAMEGGKQGEISGAEISINGALAYENKLLLNNVSLNNLINPASGNQDYNTTDLSGSSATTTVNTDLICELEVLDSNVSAEYGEFTGGVVKAKTCAPKTQVGKIHGQMSYDYTSSDWISFSHVTEGELEEYDDDNKQYQKDFVKQGLSASLYGRVTDRVGISLGLAKRWSDIDLKSDLLTVENANQKRENDNVNLNVYADLSDQHKLRVGLQFQNDQKDLEQANNLNSGKQVNSTNTALDVELVSQFQKAKITQSLVYQQQKMLNESDSDALVSWKSSPDKDWSSTNTATEGGYGTRSQQLDVLEYKIKSEFTPFHFANLEHKVSVGAGYGHYTADWQRPDSVYSYFLPSGVGLAGTSSCLNAQGDVDPYCDLSYNDGKGQFHIQRDVFGAGKIDVSQDRAHLFLEDRMNWNNLLKANIGLRADYDSLNGQTNLAPRSSFIYQPFKDNRLAFTAGWNRYYANNLFTYKLLDGVNQLNSREKRSSLQDDWTFVSASTNNVQRSELDTPYTNETVFAVNGRIGLFDAQLKYVNRDNKDQIRKKRISFTPITDEYDNYGMSEADIYTFSIANHHPIEFLSTQNRFQLGLDYSDITRNFTDYDNNSYNSLTYQQYILYQGDIIDESLRPAENFARPWSARLSWDIQHNHLPLKISHLFRYRSNYDAMASSTIPVENRPIAPNGDAIKTAYNATRIDGSFTWDMRTTYDIALAKDNKLILGLTINNLTNQDNKYTQSNSNYLYSESGRQFIADITFKF